MAPKHDPDAPGLAPLAAPSAAADVEHLRVDVLEHLPHDVKELVIGPCMDMITAGTANGESAYVIGRLRSMLRRVVRGLYECEMRRDGLLRRVDFDPTI